MKAIIFSLMSVFMLNQQSVAQVSDKDIQNYLEANYNVVEITDNVNHESNPALIDVLKSDAFITRNVSLTGLNFVNVDEVHYRNGNVAMLIPFKANTKEVLAVVVKRSDYSKILQCIIVKNHLDGRGTGSMTVTMSTGTFVSHYNNGVLNRNAPKNCFRTCFDQAYDSICDGLIGCIAWSVNPLVSVTAALYCEARC